MAFDADIRHFPTIASFDAYLQTVPRPAWCNAICHHNTYRPNELTWKGRASMQSMMAYYIGKGWSAGPHLYLAASAPDPADRGIWTMTPLAHQGIHAGQCNATHLGIENVGDFDARPPTADQYTLLITVTLLILHAWGLPPEAVNVHNECMVGRTCPGKYLTGTQIRADLRKPAPRPAPVPQRAYMVKGLPVYQASDRQGALWGHLQTGDRVAIDDPNGHLADNRGFVDINGLEPL